MEVNAVSCVLHHHSHSHTHTMAGRGGHHLENLWSHNILQKLVNSNANNTLNGLKSSIMIVITDVVTTLLQPYWSTFLVQAPLCPAGYSHLSLRSLHTRVDEFQSRTGSISPGGHISKQAFYYTALRQVMNKPDVSPAFHVPTESVCYCSTFLHLRAVSHFWFGVRQI